ncbi:ATP-binding protein [Desulfovibrio sp. TomC]|uniref:ATP-binding protein n=1 Tax=Desulfovibrio sp. TomC TaxID=1562888 RepID=UPI00057401EB|nr:ATP-binding protein [Desulfovibrio sp. TomC]KHK03829.1 MinD superfamily P-loop ATPase containing an inserted ferredoxin domain [Desulfovibrio sp. TomC]
MREIVILSGKGGAGKTSVTAAFAALAQNAVLCDLDVDAPDLHILLAPTNTLREAFVAGHLASVHADACDGCGECAGRCRFGAVVQTPEGHYAVNPAHCEGCKVCVALCPRQAIDFTPRTCGLSAVSDTRFGPLVHAQLDPGAENSGRLVALLRSKAKALAKARGLDFIISDGAPGIACPVVSSLSGANLAVLVTEPTPSGTHDLIRVASLCDHFRLPSAVILNKADLNADEAARIGDFCADTGRPVIGRLPYSPDVVRAMTARVTLPEYGGPLANTLADLWQTVAALAAAPSRPQLQPL